MNENHQHGHGECSCGQTKLQIKQPPLTRFYCHCTICQQVYDKPYADVTVNWAWDIELVENHTTIFKEYKSFLALERGTCTGCYEPTVSFLGHFPFKFLAFVPTQMYEETKNLPAPQGHIFYNSRVTSANDSLPTYQGYLESQMAVVHFLTKGMVQ
ncbi:MAG: hypothetical protein AAF518_09780 [Spirochaetota bacterium]